MKKIILGISLTLASFNPSIVKSNDLYNCPDLKLNKLIEEMKTSTQFFAKNQFDKNCLLFILNTTEKPELTLEDFKGSESLFNEYKKISSNTGFEVITLYNPSSGSFYQFFKLDEDTPALKNMKERWIRNNGKFAVYFDDFIKLHEITHLDFEAIKGIRNNHNAMESIADVSAVILLSFQEKFTVKEALNFLSAVRDIRSRSVTRKVGVRNNLGGAIQDEQGYFANETHHLDRKIFNNIIKELKSIKDQDKLLSETDLFINEKEEGIVKLVRNKYYK